MKSQDILLLLKLVAIGQRERSLRNDVSNQSLLHENWQDWHDADSGAEEPIELLLADHNNETLPTSGLYSVRSLASSTGIGKSEISNALSRCYESGLAKLSRGGTTPSVNKKGLDEFLIYGLRYVYPAKMQAFARGIATGLTAPVFGGELRAAGEQTPVWADARGNTSGLAVEPLYKTVPFAVRRDPNLYVLLALIDSLRLGLPRERNLAVSKLHELLRG